MKQKINIVVLLILFGFISTGSKAQKNLDTHYLPFQKVKIYPKSFGLNGLIFNSTFSYKPKVSSSNKIILPFDNMKCLLPPDDIKYHIQIFDLHPNDDSFIYSMPIRVPKVDLVK